MDNGPLVHVSAVGRAFAVPDAVTLSLAVEVVEQAPGAAVARVGELMTDLLGVLVTAGVEAGDRRTTGLVVNPFWPPQGGEPTGHQATSTVQVVVRDLASAGALVQEVAAVAGTALRINGFSLSVRNLEPHLALARAEAVRACRSQADQLAAAAGLCVGDLVTLAEGPGTGRMHVQLESGRASRMSGPPVEAGEHEVVIQVSGTWKLVQV